MITAEEIAKHRSLIKEGLAAKKVTEQALDERREFFRQKSYYFNFLSQVFNGMDYAKEEIKVLVHKNITPETLSDLPEWITYKSRGYGKFTVTINDNPCKE